jgi:hypothetical protein
MTAGAGARNSHVVKRRFRRSHDATMGTVRASVAVK